MSCCSIYSPDVSLTWLEHVARRLHEREDKPRSGSLGLVPYYPWGRDEDDVGARWQAVPPERMPERQP